MFRLTNEAVKMQALGVDIGGTGIKGAPVDVETGALLAERYRTPTPEGAKPEAVAKVVARIAKHFSWHDAIGCGFPAVVQGGVALTAANVHRKWVGTDVTQLLSEATGCAVHVLNDADAAGMAEVTFGAGKGQPGVILVITIGTGLGSALFVDGKLVPNTELGHLEVGGEDAELNASDVARKRQDLTWKKWAARLDRYLTALEKLFWPDLFILGGGIVKQHERFLPLLTLRAKVVPAQFGNNAGIVGAALAAALRK